MQTTRVKSLLLSIVFTAIACGALSSLAFADDFNFSGTWSMVANVSPGTLTINQVGSTITGTMDADQIQGRAIGNKIYFTRLCGGGNPLYHQQYEGQLFFNRNGKDVIAGIFNYVDIYNYGWHAVRQ